MNIAKFTKDLGHQRKLMPLPPPPLARLKALLATLAMLLGLGGAAVGAEQCDASHIVMTQPFPTEPLMENSPSGAIIRFKLEGCDNLGSFEMPRDYPIPFCAEIFDTTPCNANARNCLANNVAGARGVLVMSDVKRVGEFKVCSTIDVGESFKSVIVIQYNNNFVDVGENSIFAIMRNPTRHLRVPIQDDD